VPVARNRAPLFPEGAVNWIGPDCDRGECRLQRSTTVESSVPHNAGKRVCVQLRVPSLTRLLFPPCFPALPCRAYMPSLRDWVAVLLHRSCYFELLLSKPLTYSAKFWRTAPAAVRTR
jgi:hypothetical protein